MVMGNSLIGSFLTSEWENVEEKFSLFSDQEKEGIYQDKQHPSPPIDGPRKTSSNPK